MMLRHSYIIAALLLSSCSMTQKPASYVAYGTGKGAGSAGIHTVLRGDTLYSVSENYNLPMREIITLNKLSAPYKLNVGYRMKLPPPNEHQVRDGDTLYGVARTYDVSINRLVEMNDIRPPYKLQLGDRLRLPTPTRMNHSYNTDNATFQTVSSVRVGEVEREVLGAPQKTEQKSTRLSPRQPPEKSKPTSPRPSIDKTPELSGNGRFMKPVEGRIISSFGAKNNGLHNDGINIKAVRGAPVRAAENGVVVYSGDDLEGYGNLILVRHQNRMVTAYAHLHKSLVKRGDKVQRGQSIGTVGSTGQVDSPQLHFEIRKGSKVLNPAKYI